MWAHNTHVGDARATHMGDGGVNLGQLARERFGAGAVRVGFTTYDGTVIAAREWGAPGERRDVRPSIPGSFGYVFHAAGSPPSTSRSAAGRRRRRCATGGCSAPSG